MGLVPCAYYFFLYGDILEHIAFTETTTTEIVLFFMLAISLFEGGRRLVGWAMPTVAGFFIFHAFFCNLFPGPLYSRPFSLPRLASSFYLSAEGIFGMPVGVASTIVVMFMIFAYFLLFSGGGKFFIDLALSIVGHVRGGPAKAAIVASSLFGTLTGTVSGNVAATGSVTIPLMKSTGYTPEFAGAVEAVASNGGQIMPPVMGAVAFVMAEMTGISYIKICLAAVLPAILYYCGLFAQVDLEALRLGLRGMPREELPSVKEVLKGGWQYLAPLVALIVFLAVFRCTPQRSALYALGVLVAVSMFNKESRMGPYKLIVALEGAGKAMCVVTLTCALSGIIIGSLLTTGVGINLAIGIVDFSGTNLYLLAGVTAITCFILGMGMSSIPIYIMLAVLISPALLMAGVPVIAGHLFVLYFGLVSFITPPVCVAAFVAAGIAQSNPMKTGWTATRLGIVTYIVPFMFIFNPVLVGVGTAAEIASASVTSIAGVLILAMGVVGRMYKDMGRLILAERVLLIASALLMMLPGWVSDIVGGGIAAMVIVWRVTRQRQVANNE